MSKILWIDDNPTVTELVAELLSRSGHSVQVLQSWDGGDIRPETFDLVIIDLFVEVEKDGKPRTEFGLEYLFRMLHSEDRFLQAVDSGRTKCLLLSQHLAELDLRERIKKFTEENQVRAFLRSKTHESREHGSRREAIASVIESVVNEDRGPLLSDEVEALLEPPESESFFSIDLTRFRDLPDSIQAELQESAIRQISSDAQVEFDLDPELEWVMFCGGIEVMRRGKLVDMPPAQDRRATAEAHGHPVLVLARPDTPAPVEELFGRRRRSSGPSNGLRCDGKMSDYPTIDLEVAGSLRSYHFDTGSDSSFMRASYVRDGGTPLRTEDRIVYRGKYGRYFAYELPADGIECILVDQESSSHLKVSVEGYAIEPFKKWGYARRCSDFGCSLGSLGEPCMVRSGLIGRGFLADNQLSIEISSLTPLTKIRKC
jgi:CheY-like chemotaxis protein